MSVATVAMAPVASRRLHEAVVDALLRQIVGGQVAPGALLPSETVLAAQLGVSRTVLREATRLLAAKGLVRVKHGSGVWVQPAEAWDRLDPAILHTQVQLSRDAAVLDDVLEARRLIEIELVGLAARRRTAADLRGLHQALLGLRASLAEFGSFGQWDLAFHDQIYRAAQNPVLRNTVVPVITTLFQVREQITDRDVAHVERSQAGHEVIWQAIEGGDEAGARAAMLRHVVQFEDELRASNLFARPDSHVVRRAR